MANPRVSPYNWERLRGLVQIDIGTDRVEAKQMGFSKQLDVAIGDPEEGNTYREEVNEFTFGKKDSDRYSHTYWENGVEIEIDPEHQTRPHRPYVSKELIEKLEKAVKEEYPNVPVESYSFDDLLGLYLDRKEEYLEYLDCRLVEEGE